MFSVPLSFKLPDRALPGALPFGVRTFLPYDSARRTSSNGDRLAHCGLNSTLRRRRSAPGGAGRGATAGGT